MRRKSTLLALLFLAAGAYAQEQQPYLSGKLLQMNSVRCAVSGQAEHGSTKDNLKDNRNTTVTDHGSNNPSDDSLDAASQICFEYLLQADEVIYTIRQKNSRHESLLPVGEWAQFRIQKDKFFLRVRSSESREREYIVISIKPRAENSANSIRVHLNHLQ